MTQSIGRGGTIILDVNFTDSSGTLVDADPVTVDIINPSSTEIVSNASPTTNPSTGVYTYSYLVPVDAPLGSWTVRFCGVINSVPRCGEETFTVLDAGSVVFPSSTPRTGVCTAWATADDVCSPCTGTEEGIAAALLEASDVLFELSAQRFAGPCQSPPIRPCVNSAYRGPGFSTAPSTIPLHSPWASFFYSPSSDACCYNALRLSLFPVTSIISVRLDGELLVNGVDYQLVGYRDLMRLPASDGSRPGWPVSQDLALSSTEPGTFEVTYVYGQSPPRLGVRAAAALACNIVKWCDTPEDCQLPDNVASVTRDGISFNMQNPDAVREGLLGLDKVIDTFIQTYNRRGITRTAGIWSSDTLPRHARIT